MFALRAELPTSVVITGVDGMPILEQALAAAQSFQPMPEQDLSALLAKTADAAKDGRFELFKTTAHFDSTAQHPEYLGPDSPRTQDLTKS